MSSPTKQIAQAAASSAPEKIEAMVQRIAERFEPEKIILFGSYARGTAGPDSDVDLLVVMPVRGSKRDTQLEIRRALREFRIPKDVVVTTPEDFAWRKEVPGTIERPAAREGKVLYDRP
jgi:predicted nucleotidyltransferase